MEKREGPMRGKGAMVWRLREWQGGDPLRQVAQATDLGLDWVSIKVHNKTDIRWDGSIPKQNDDLLPQIVPALQRAGVAVGAWGWTEGRRGAPIFASIAAQEAEVGASQVRKYSLAFYQDDAEAAWKRPGLGMSGQATIQAQRLEVLLPEIAISLCSYRFPNLHSSFPWQQFLANADHHSPQVYFLGRTNADAGVNDLRVSHAQLTALRDLPFTPIFPTYEWADGWRASKLQLTLAFQEAVNMGLFGVGVWKLEGASSDQLAAIREFAWPTVPPPAPIPPIAEGYPRLWTRASSEWPDL
jgi:hypothetical protein